jgi:hypothetical protein
MVSPVHGDYRRCQAETPLSDLFKFAEPALQSKKERLCEKGVTGLSLRHSKMGDVSSAKVGVLICRHRGHAALPGTHGDLVEERAWRDQALD